MFRACLAFAAFAALSVSEPLINAAPPASADTIISYRDLAESQKVASALREFKSSHRGNRFVTLTPKDYYLEKRFGPNALMCGEGADKAAVISLLKALRSKGVTIQYVGAYSRNELNSRRDVIDVRPIGDVAFFKKYRPINPNKVTTGSFECGHRKKGVFGDRVN